MSSTGSYDLPDVTWRVVVASHNPAKLQAVRDGFSRMFPVVMLSVQPVAAASGVAEQPFSDQDTLRGACQRAQNARELAPDASFWVGIEGGVQDCEGELAAFAWVVVLALVPFKKPHLYGNERS
jgi:inosine/xanthosine triphosphatase